jgi:hypothetical protein
MARSAVRVLKIRLGHEANCSSGQVAAILWFFGRYVSLLVSFLTSVIIAAARIKRIRAGLIESRIPLRYWAIPLAVPLTGLLLCEMASIWGSTAVWLVVGVTGLLVIMQAVSTGIGYILIQRATRPLWIVSIVPLVVVILIGLPMLVGAMIVLVDEIVSGAPLAEAMVDAWNLLLEGWEIWLWPWR